MINKNVKILIFFIISVLLGILLVFFNKNTNNIPSNNEIKKVYQKGKKFDKNNSNQKIKHVFFDLGTNNGDSVKFFVDKSERKHNGYEVLKGYGALNNKTWEIYAIEANPFFNKILLDTKTYCERLGHTVNLLTETAAWTKNEKLVFYLDTVNVNVNYWGSSLFKQHPDVVSSGLKNATVDGIDISELLKKYTHDDEIVMKIDIEGAEYDLLLHLIKDGTLHLVDIIAIEYHPNFVKGSINNPTELQNFFSQYFSYFNVKLIHWW